MAKSATRSSTGSSRPRSPRTIPPEPSGEADRSKPATVPASRLSRGLYLVATPIGNAADISVRALETLAAADMVACEDTRVTGKLLSMHNVKSNLTAYHDHNAAQVLPGLIERMNAGAAIALVTDAGMPSISDPGYRVVRACIENGVPLTAVPGPSAGLTALILSGLPTNRFLFDGFPPNKQQARRNEFEALATVPSTLIFQESAPRLAASLADMATVFGGRPAAVARELTKMYEEVRRGSLDELAAHYAEAGPPKGEVVVVVGPPLEIAPDRDQVDGMIRSRLGGTSVKDIAAEIAEHTGLAKRDIYQRALELSREPAEK